MAQFEEQNFQKYLDGYDPEQWANGLTHADLMAVQHESRLASQNDGLKDKTLLCPVCKGGLITARLPDDLEKYSEDIRKAGDQHVFLSLKKKRKIVEEVQRGDKSNKEIASDLTVSEMSVKRAKRGDLDMSEESQELYLKRISKIISRKNEHLDLKPEIVEFVINQLLKELE